MNVQFMLDKNIIEWVRNESVYKNVSGYVLYAMELYISEDIYIPKKVVYKNVNCSTSLKEECYILFKSKCKDNNIKMNKVINYIFEKYIIYKDLKLNIKKVINYKPSTANKEKIIINFPEELAKYKLSIYDEEKIFNTLKNFKIKLKFFDNKITTEYVISNIYKMIFIFKYTTGEISKCFNRDLRTVQRWLINLGWALDKFEAQQRIVDRGLRDYKEIRNKGKMTILENSKVGSSPEEFARQIINLRLPIVLPNSEIIVGLNNTSILEDGKEIDIPIIIIHNSNIYKYAVEYNGDYWHKDTIRDDKKAELISNKGYKLFYISPKHNATQKQVQEFINEEVEKIGEYIKNEIYS